MYYIAITTVESSTSSTSLHSMNLAMFIVSLFFFCLPVCACVTTCTRPILQQPNWFTFVVSVALCLGKQVHAAKHSPNKASSRASRDKFAVRDSDAENETPFTNDSLAQINDLISKAASLDPQLAAASDGADSGGEEMLTML